MLLLPYTRNQSPYYALSGALINKYGVRLRTTCAGQLIGNDLAAVPPPTIAVFLMPPFPIPGCPREVSQTHEKKKVSVGFPRSATPLLSFLHF